MVLEEKKKKKKKKIKNSKVYYIIPNIYHQQIINLLQMKDFNFPSINTESLLCQHNLLKYKPYPYGYKNGTKLGILSIISPTSYQFLKQQYNANIKGPDIRITITQKDDQLIKTSEQDDDHGETTEEEPVTCVAEEEAVEEAAVEEAVEEAVENSSQESATTQEDTTKVITPWDNIHIRYDTLGFCYQCFNEYSLQEIEKDNNFTNGILYLRKARNYNTLLSQVSQLYKQTCSTNMKLASYYTTNRLRREKIITNVSAIQNINFLKLQIMQLIDISPACIILFWGKTLLKDGYKTLKDYHICNQGIIFYLEIDEDQAELNTQYMNDEEYIHSLLTNDDEMNQKETGFHGSLLTTQNYIK